MTRTFVAALRFEWIRLRSVRSTWLLLVGALISAGLVAWVLAREVGRGEAILTDPETVASLLTGSSGVGPLSLPALFLGLVGVAAFGAEYRHAMMHTTLTAVPRRGVLLTAKLVVVGLFAAVAAVLSIAVAYLVGRVEIGSAFAPTVLEADAVPRALAGFGALVVLTALLGVAFGALLRSTILAGVALVAIPALVEPLAIWALTGVSGGAEIAARMPFTAGAQMVNLPGADGPGFDLVALGALAGGLTFGAFVALCALASSVSFVRRDA